MISGKIEGAFPEVYSFEREIMQNRQYYLVSVITFWKCTPLLRTPFLHILKHGLSLSVLREV